MVDPAVVLVETPSLTVAHFGDICIAVPRGSVSVEGVRQIHDGLEQLAGRVKNGVGMLFVVAEQVTPPSGDARRGVAEMFRAMRPQLKIVAGHLAGTGFLAAAKRSVFTWAASQMLGKTPIRAFSDLTEATDWMRAQATKLELTCPSSLDLQAFAKAKRGT